MFEKCANCGMRILAGGVPFLDWTFCSNTCKYIFQSKIIDQLLPSEVVEQHVQKMFEGPCPECGKEARNDVYSSTTVTGLVLAYKVESERHVCCPSCARKHRLGAALHCLVAGWWSPKAAFYTLFLIPANLLACLFIRTPKEPSVRFTRRMKSSLAESMQPQIVALMNDMQATEAEQSQ